LDRRSDAVLEYASGLECLFFQESDSQSN